MKFPRWWYRIINRLVPSRRRAAAICEAFDLTRERAEAILGDGEGFPEVAPRITTADSVLWHTKRRPTMGFTPEFGLNHNVVVRFAEPKQRHAAWDYDVDVQFHVYRCRARLLNDACSMPSEPDPCGGISVAAAQEEALVPDKSRELLNAPHLKGNGPTGGRL